MQRLESEPQRNATEAAIELHETVHPARWCITFADLKCFQSDVRQAIKGGQTFQENFEASYGPSIYAVNEHYIKPVTAAAGKMSWALMMNPDGLDCDLFITHAWQEGVFEFTQKVLTSWPWRASHAWCCMLANPQNLDIGALLQSPSSSPFALALQSSKFMLVVPNRHKSVYTRLWCGYEAYLAFQSNKIIRTATPPIWREVLFSWLRMLLIGMFAGIIAKVGEFDRALQLILIMKMLALLASLVSQNCGQMMLCLIANHVGIASVIVSMTVMGSLGKATTSAFQRKNQLVFENQNVLCSCMVVYFLLAEVDRLNCQIAKNEADQLQDQYLGSIQYASCSEIQDEMNIRHEVGDQIDEVDKVIQVLLKAGMTSDALRAASLQGVELQHAGVVQLAIPALAMGPLLLLACWHVGRYLFLLSDEQVPRFYCILTLMQGLSIVARLGILTIFCRRYIDERCFMLNVMAKTVAPSFFCYVEFKFLQDYHYVTFVSLRCWYHLSFFLTLFFSFLGIRGTLTLGYA